MALLQEYLNENQHRNYPMTDAASARDETDSMNLPQTLMADMVLNVPATSDMAKFFISNVIIRSLSVDITVSYEKPDTSIIEIGVFSEIPMDSGVHSVHNISTSPQTLTADKEFEAVTGSVTVGLVDDVKSIPGSWDFSLANGNLITSVIHAGLIGVRQITVGPDTFSGNIVLREGTNITIDSEYDAINDKYILTISAADVDTGLTLQNDQNVFDALVAEFGEPLTRINGVAPDDAGNFILSGLDCTEISNVAGGASINNPCAKPCCDKSYLDGAYDNLAELNSRFARIIDFYTAVSTNINSLQNKLAMLQLNTNIDL